jgi:transketolase
VNTSQDLIQRSINTIRFLSADGVQQANSGHPGLPMGAAAVTYTLWMRHLRFNPVNPHWFDRDRFVLSGGHGSMLLYSLLHLTGFDLSLEELKHFRQWGSLTPGHPEVGLTPGVETTTGPLGQGFTNAVGLAIAEAHLAAVYNQPEHEIINHFTYCIVGDGDLMEGIASEAASLAGHLKLRKLIVLYDDNRISIDGSTELAFSEDRAARFLTYGWQLLHVADGNNVEEVDMAISKAKESQVPSLIVCRTHIGFGLPTKQDTEKAHGEPPGMEELNAAKNILGWPLEPMFFIPEDVLSHFREKQARGMELEKEWQQGMDHYKSGYPQQYADLTRRMKTELPEAWDKDLPKFPEDSKGIATRASSGKVMNALALRLPELVGGSADLTPSTKTWLDGSPAFQADSPLGRNFHFGVREHAMGGIVNGMALHGGLIPFGATFLVFSDYMRGSLRISALSHIPSIWIFTHDSIGLGEDGPTHQPVEQLAALRAIPNMAVIRPADANEVREAWKVAIQRRDGPTALILTRQNVPTLDRNVVAPAEGLSKGAYVLKDFSSEEPEMIIMASGSEVSLILKAAEELSGEGRRIRVVSFPCWELFAAQSIDYQETVLPPNVKRRLVVEAGVPMGWDRWLGQGGKVIGMNRFGASAPAEILYTKFGFTIENIIAEAKKLLE